MLDCSKDVAGYHGDKVALPKDMRDQMRAHRDANRERLHASLTRDEKPAVIEHVIQGSYAMHTMVQSEQNDFDIDDGVVFGYEDLKGLQGGNMPPGNAKQMVCEALQDERFNQTPEVRTNCVRVYYAGGYHVDIPVYRQMSGTKGGEETWLELASAEWKKSDARAVTQWFKDAVKTRSPAGEPDQLRTLVRLLKAFSKSRSTWNSPSGLILSVLAKEQYMPREGRLDEAFYYTIRNIHDRLTCNLMVKHPVLAESITRTPEDACMTDFRDHLQKAVDWLSPLEDEHICTRNEALKAWDQVFNTDYFTNGGGSGAKKLESTFVIGASTPSSAANKGGGGGHWA